MIMQADRIINSHVKRSGMGSPTVRSVCFYRGLRKGVTQKMAHDYINNQGDGGESRCVRRRQEF